MLIDNNTILNIITRIATGFQPDKIFLFGSYAIGQATEDSDIDLLVIKDTNESRPNRSIAIQRLLIGTKVPVDVLVYTNEEFEKEKSNQMSFVNKAILKSKLLYERR